jgi:hypothetical protein
MEFASAERFTVRVLRSDLSGPAGVGVVVGDRHIFTCAHVVNVALGEDEDAQAEPGSHAVIMIDFPRVVGAESAVPHKCKIVAWRPPPHQGIPGQDIAGLELVDGALPGRAGLAKLIDPTGLSNVPVQVFGYPVIPKDPRPNGVLAPLRLVGGVAGGLIQLERDEGAAYHTEKGFSGSPVVTKYAAGDAVVGIFAKVSDNKQAKDSYAISVAALLDAWPDANSSAVAPEPSPWGTGYGVPLSSAGHLNRYGMFSPPTPPSYEKPVHELQSEPPHFFGRAKESQRLIAWLNQPGNGRRVVNICGIPGSGKSALALHVAHAVAGQHPDCQLYFNLRASDQSLVSPEELLGQKLITLGMPPAEIPAGLQARAAEYRSRLWGRRPLIMIENATTAEQIRPLLPDTRGAAVIITSWTLITNVPGLEALRLQPLDDSAALDMLASSAGRQVAAADRETVLQIVRFLGNLPLALPTAGGILRKREYWTWQTLYDRLRAEAANPEAKPVVIGSKEIQGSFELAYRELEEQDQDTALGYRLLGLAPTARMSRGLVKALISANPLEAEEIIDQLADYQLLQSESVSDGSTRSEARAFRMHDLFWLRARSLVAEADDQETRDAAVQRMTMWSLAQLGSRYLDRLKSGLSTLPSVLDHGKRMSLPDTYIETAVVSSDPSQPALPGNTLSGLFPHPCQRLLLMAPGGSGKTTMAGHLCLQAASQGLGPSGPGVIPIMVLIRDIQSGTEDISIESLILRTLRYRYESDVTPDALRVALEDARVFVIVDGLDEVMPDLRRRVTTSINEFAASYSRVPVLVTTRPYATAQQAFPAFTVATIAPWTPHQARTYLERIAQGHDLGDLPARLAQQDDLGLIGTPLGLQLLAVLYWRRGTIPATFTFLVEGILQLLIGARETSRGVTWQGTPDEVRAALEHVAFAMQSNPDNRITVTRKEIRSILDFSRTGDRDLASRDHLITSGRLGVMVEIGAELFAFVHTAFREHLAASHVARMPLPDAVTVMRAHFQDPSWDAIFAMAFELARWPLETADAATDDPALRDAIRSWVRQAGGSRLF